MEKRRQRQSFELVFISKASLPNQIFTTDSLHHFQLSRHVGLVLKGSTYYFVYWQTINYECCLLSSNIEYPQICIFTYLFLCNVPYIH